MAVVLNNLITNIKKNEQQIWSVLVLLFIGVFSLFYIMFKRAFAKIYFEFSFLNFPVFLGEFLLFFCLILSISYWIRYQPRFKPAYFLILVYVLWLIYKVVVGYYHWGPLALRHAALFYYPFFAVISYIFFKRRLFKQWVVTTLFFLIIAVFIVGHPDRYWTFTLASLGVILILKNKEKPLSYIMIGALLLTLPYTLLVNTARMMFVANIVSLALLALGVLYLLRIKIFIKVIIIIFLASVMSFAFYKFFILGESGRTFSSPREVLNTFKELDEEVNKKEKMKETSIHSVGLFNSVIPEEKFYYNVDPVYGKKVPAQLEINKTGLVEDKNKTLGVEKDRKKHVKEIVMLNWKSFEYRNKSSIESNTSESSLGGVSTNNIVFRLFIWRDMYKDWNVDKPILGVDFGKAFLSPSLVALSWAESEWGRDGWIEPHNSFFNILYRAGLVGIILVISIWGALFWLIKIAFDKHSWPLLLLAAILLNWMVAANFLLILEVPYTAIPFWILAGMSFAYAIKR